MCMTVHTAPSNDGEASMDNATGLTLDDTIVLRYWLGEVSPDERATVERWFAEHPDARPRYNQLRQGLQAGGWTAWTPQTIADRTITILQATGGLATPTPKARTARRPVLSIQSLIAGIASVALFAFGWHALDRHEATPRIVGGSVYTTANGERATITLADQSTVTLSVGSRLEIPADYAAGHRTLRRTTGWLAAMVAAQASMRSPVTSSSRIEPNAGTRCARMIER